MDLSTEESRRIDLIVKLEILSNYYEIENLFSAEKLKVMSTKDLEKEYAALLEQINRIKFTDRLTILSTFGYKINMEALASMSSEDLEKEYNKWNQEIKRKILIEKFNTIAKCGYEIPKIDELAIEELEKEYKELIVKLSENKRIFNRLAEILEGLDIETYNQIIENVSKGLGVKNRKILQQIAEVFVKKLKD